MNPNMMNKLKKMQKDMMEAQEKLEKTEFIGKATGVSVVMLGNRQLIDVKIDPELLTEHEILQEAVLMAVNNATTQIDKAQESSMGQFSGGLGGFGF